MGHYCWSQFTVALPSKPPGELTYNSIPLPSPSKCHYRMLTFWPRNSFFSERMVMPAAAALLVPGVASLPAVF